MSANNTIKQHLWISIRLTVLLSIFTGLIFPFVVYWLAHLFFPREAEGSLIYNKIGIVLGSRVKVVLGSRLIGQNFIQPQYFHARPSAAGSGYDATVSGGTNLGPTSKKLLEGAVSFLGIKQLAENYRQENNLAPETKIPIDAVTYSGSGLDPHISIENAKLQIERVAKSRKMPPLAVLAFVKANLTQRQFGFMGEPVVNVFLLNLTLDEYSNSHSK